MCVCVFFFKKKVVAKDEDKKKRLLNFFSFYFFRVKYVFNKWFMRIESVCSIKFVGWGW